MSGESQGEWQVPPVPGPLGSHHSLTHSIKSRQHTDVHPAVEIGGRQPELQSVGPILFSELEAQSRHRGLPPGLQLGPKFTQDLCLVGPLVLEVPEDIIKDDQLHITATPEVRATAERAALWREVQLRPWALQEPQPSRNLQWPGMWLSLMLDLSSALGPNARELQELSCLCGACLQVH